MDELKKFRRKNEFGYYELVTEDLSKRTVYEPIDGFLYCSSYTEPLNHRVHNSRLLLVKMYLPLPPKSLWQKIKEWMN